MPMAQWGGGHHHLPHLGAAVRDEDGAVLVDVHERAALVHELGGEVDAVLGRQHAQPALPPRVRLGGEAMGGEAMGGEVMGGEAMGGEAMGGEAMGGEAMGGEAMGGEERRARGRGINTLLKSATFARRAATSADATSSRHARGTRHAWSPIGCPKWVTSSCAYRLASRRASVPTPSSAASWSTMASVMSMPCGPPKPRKAVCGGWCVLHTTPRQRSDGHLYELSTCSRAPGWSEAAKSASWAWLCVRATPALCGLRCCVGPSGCVEQPRAVGRRLMSLWWPAVAPPRRPL